MEDGRPEMGKETKRRITLAVPFVETCPKCFVPDDWCGKLLVG
jgi:hypothetical protein